MTSWTLGRSVAVQGPVDTDLRASATTFSYSPRTIVVAFFPAKEAVLFLWFPETGKGKLGGRGRNSNRQGRRPQKTKRLFMVGRRPVGGFALRTT